MVIEVDRSTAKNWKNKVSEFDPVVCFSWKDELSLGLQAANLAHPALPGWSPTGYPITASDFKTAVLLYCQVGATAGGVVDSFIIAPNTLVEATSVTVKVASLSLDPLTVLVANAANTSLARTHLFTDKTSRLTSTPVSVVRPLALGVGDIQAPV